MDTGTARAAYEFVFQFHIRVEFRSDRMFLPANPQWLMQYEITATVKCDTCTSIIAEIHGPTAAELRRSVQTCEKTATKRLCARRPSIYACFVPWVASPSAFTVDPYKSLRNR